MTSIQVLFFMLDLCRCAERLGHNVEQWTNEKAMDWAKAGFPEPVAPVMEGNILMH